MSGGFGSPVNPSISFESRTQFDHGMREAEMDFITLLEDEVKLPQRAKFLKDNLL